MLSAAAGTYADRKAAIEGYALLAMEYHRRDKAQAHCLLTPDAAGSSALAKFLRGQLEANGIRGGELARMVVVADELSPCAGAGRPGTGGSWPSAPYPGGGADPLRLRGDFGGVSPWSGWRRRRSTPRPSSRPTATGRCLSTRSPWIPSRRSSG